jgi:predicted ester cyclase
MPTDEAPGYDFFYKFFAGFSDLVSDEDAILSDGDRVAIQWTMTGTQTADFFGLPPTDRTVTVSGMDALRVEDGKFVEHWGGIADQMDEIIAQLTAEP